jgi:RHS repeat-associated protein
MQYNADGQRVARGEAGDTKKFFYDFNNLLKELDGDGDTTETYTSTTEEYGDLVSEYDDTAGAGYYHEDGLGSTDALVHPAQPSTDAWVYRAFGQVESRTGTDDTPFGFAGRPGYYHEPQLDLYFLRARFYDPATGQFVSEDPAGVDADENLYRYVGNNPVDERACGNPEQGAAGGSVGAQRERGMDGVIMLGGATQRDDDQYHSLRRHVDHRPVGRHDHDHADGQRAGNRGDACQTSRDQPRWQDVGEF